MSSVTGVVRRVVSKERFDMHLSSSDRDGGSCILEGSDLLLSGPRGREFESMRIMKSYI